jgi:transcriptional regulator with XRE-family HTH domain
MGLHLSVNRLIGRMREQGVTSMRLAEEVGVTRQAVYNLTKGKNQPRIETLDRIAAALGCTPQSLLMTNARYTDYTRFADVVMSRYGREGDGYDVAAETMGHARDWLTEYYDDLSRDQFDEAEEIVIERCEPFAGHVAELLELFRLLHVSDEHQTSIVHEAFLTFFEDLQDRLDKTFVNDEPA